jgi:hypothetical protein
MNKCSVSRILGAIFFTATGFNHYIEHILMLLFGELTKEEKIKGYSTANAGIEELFAENYYSYFKRRALLCVEKYF